ncbi:MAG: precorrin-6Y C5,15-methyltransferase (decarboxylating) subunit CbiT [Methanobrevibacter sp.]|nr:precorrin-6Y C5,15-methyltransferase (decarboxylating) subunit CbiT [Methanobrevibacter sp.]
MIKDSEFIKSNDVPGPTKEEIRCLIRCKSEVSHDSFVVDIGCGTGGITTEMAKIAKKVIAIDKNSKAIEITSQNINKFNLSEKVELIKDDALSALNSNQEIKDKRIDIAIIGGSNNDLDILIETIISLLKSNGKIVVTAILNETKVEAIKKFKELGFDVEIVEVNVSKGKIIDRGTMMMAQNPIAIITATKNS